MDNPHNPIHEYLLRYGGNLIYCLENLLPDRELIAVVDGDPDKRSAYIFVSNGFKEAPKKEYSGVGRVTQDLHMVRRSPRHDAIKSITFNPSKYIFTVTRRMEMLALTSLDDFKNAADITSKIVAKRDEQKFTLTSDMEENGIYVLIPHFELGKELRRQVVERYGA